MIENRPAFRRITLYDLFLMVVDVGIFGVLSAFLANAFISPRRNPPASPSSAELASLKDELHEIHRLLAQIQDRAAETQTQNDKEA